MRLYAGKCANALKIGVSLAACALFAAPAAAADMTGEHSSRLLQLVDRLQTGSIDREADDHATAAATPEGCAVPAASSDKDVKRHSRDLEGLCVETVRFSENDVEWTLQRISSGKPGPLWTVFHDDGDAAFSAALYGLKRYGGTLIAVETQEHALHAGLDPEDLFETGGIEDNTSRVWPRYAALFIYEAIEAQAVISLRSSSVLSPGKTGNLIMTGVDSQFVGKVRGTGPMPDLELSWLDTDNAASVSPFAERLFTLGPVPYFRVEASGESWASCKKMIDSIASAASLPRLASSKDHYSAQGKLNTN